MRRIILAIFVGLAVLAEIVFTTPLRFALFPTPLTTNQQRILHRASTGLAVLATKSATANSLYQEVQQSGRWSECMAVIPTNDRAGRKRKMFSVTVMSSNPFGLLAFYLHPTKSVCFMEEKCESLGFLPLGLTYAHELEHRRDFERGLVKVSDLPDSDPVKRSEARCRLIEAAILDEYTQGRFSAAVGQHIQAYRKQPAAIRRKQRVNELMLDIDANWVKQEFGALSAYDRNQLLGPFLFMASVRMHLPKRYASSQDSLDAAVAVLKK